MVHMSTLMRGRVGEHIYIYICVYIYTYKNISQKYGSHMGEQSNSLYWEKGSSVTEISVKINFSIVGTSARD